MLKTDMNSDSAGFAYAGPKTCSLWFILGIVYHGWVGHYFGSAFSFSFRPNISIFP